MEIEEFQPFDFIYKKGDVGRSGHLLRFGPELWALGSLGYQEFDIDVSICIDLQDVPPTQVMCCSLAWRLQKPMQRRQTTY